MSRGHRPSKADRKPVTRRYVARTVQRARDEIIRALIFATIPVFEPPPGMSIEPVTEDRFARVLGPQRRES